jgi:hypothetical protein
MAKNSAISPTNTNVVVETRQSSWWSQLTPGQRKLITTVAISLGITLLAAGTIYFGTRFVRAKIANVEENKSLGEDKYATWAKQIKNSFDNNGWWGTDEELLRSVLREIPTKEDFKKVQQSYKKLFMGANLIADMTGELKQTEYNEMLAIINAKPSTKKEYDAGARSYDPHGWAKRINAALSYNWLGLFWGTDMPAINAVILEIPTQAAFYEMARAYKQLYGVSLISDLRGDMQEYEVQMLVAKVVKKPKK